MNLDTDLQRILNINAKIYNSQTKRQGKVISVSPELVIVDYGNKARSDTQEYDIEDFSQMLIDDVIVANSRLTMDSRDNFQIKPRVKSAQHSVGNTSLTVDISENARIPVSITSSVISLNQPEANQSPLETGYINFSTGNYSAEPKKGYVRVEFRKCVEKVTLEVDSEGMEKLRELGLIK